MASELQARTGFSLTWNRRVTPRGRAWWVLGTSELLIDEIASGSAPSIDGSWITPQARDGDDRGIQRMDERRAQGHGATLPEQMSMWTTPTADDGHLRSADLRPSRVASDYLSRQVLWPTAKAVDGRAKGNGGARNSPGLDQMARQGNLEEWPSPAARDWRDDGEMPSAQARNSPCLPAAVRLEAATPSATPYGSSNNGCPGDGREEYATKGRPSLEGMACWATPRTLDARDITTSRRARELSSERAKPSLTDQVRGFDASGELRGVSWARARAMAQGEFWPTPTAQDARASGSAGYSSGHTGTTLTDATVGPRGEPNAQAQIWPTPTAGDAKASGSRNTADSAANFGVSLTDAIRQDGGSGRRDQGNRNTTGRPPASSSPRGHLNHRWVCQLQGFPADWLDIDEKP